MKCKLIFSSATVLLVLLFVGCKKDHAAPAPVAIVLEGMYTGNCGSGNEVPATPLKYNFKTGGIIENISPYNGTLVALGTWTLNAHVLKGSYATFFPPYSKRSFLADFDYATGKITGTWGLDNNYSNGGKIEMTKQ